MAVGARIAAVPRAIRPVETRLRTAIVNLGWVRVSLVLLRVSDAFMVAVCDERSDLAMDELTIFRRVIVRPRVMFMVGS